MLPRAVSRPWGGQRIAPAMGWPQEGAVGEWWLLSCHPAAVTGVEPSRAAPAGEASDPPTDPDEGRVDERADGPPNGSADDAPEGPPPVPSAGEGLDGWLDGPEAPAGLPDGDDFPLLLKFLDTDDVLSVQVHPNDAVARRHGMRHGKTEAWHVLAAEPEACLYLGTAPGVSAATLLDAVARGARNQDVAAMLRRVPAVPGETWLVEAGTIHAVGAGVTLFELQQTSDATWRLYDWERAPARALHLEQARSGARDHPPVAPVPPPSCASGWTPLVTCHAFALERGRVAGELPVPGNPAWSALTVLTGRGTLHCDDGEHGLCPGHTLLTWGGGTLRGEGLSLLRSSPAPSA